MRPATRCSCGGSRSTPTTSSRWRTARPAPSRSATRSTWRRPRSADQARGGARQRGSRHRRRGRRAVRRRVCGWRPAGRRRASRPAPRWRPTGWQAAQVSLSSSTGGAAVVVWVHRWDAASASRVARAAYRPAGGEFGEPVDLTAPVLGVFDSEVAASVDEAGDAHVAWTRLTPDDDHRLPRARAGARCHRARPPRCRRSRDGHRRSAGRDVRLGHRPVVGPAVDHVGLRRRQHGHGCGRPRTCTPRPGPTSSG